MQTNKPTGRSNDMFGKSIVAGILLLSLAACQDKPVAATVPAATLASTPAPVVQGVQPSDDLLMTAVYGQRYRPRTRDAMVPIYDSRFESKQLFRVKALANTVLATGETVLLTRGEHVDKRDNSSEIYGDYFGMNAYFLRQVEGAWTVIGRHEDVTRLGISEGVGGVSWIKLGKGKQGLAVRSGERWGKCALEYLTLFELAGTRLQRLSDGIASKSISKGMCVRDRRFSHWNVESKWHMAAPASASSHDDLIMVFSGDDASPPNIVNVDDEPTGPLVQTKVNGTARYAYDAKLKQYALVEGDNLVPTNEDDYD